MISFPDFFLETYLTGSWCLPDIWCVVPPVVPLCGCLAPGLVSLNHGSGSVSTQREAVLFYYLAPLNAVVSILRCP